MALRCKNRALNSVGLTACHDGTPSWLGAGFDRFIQVELPDEDPFHGPIGEVGLLEDWSL